MKHYSRWGGLGPYDDDTGYHYHWYNRSRVWRGDSYEITVGDLLARDEEEMGGTIAPSLHLELQLSQNDIGQFDEHQSVRPYELIAKRDVHYFTAMLWRWGVSVALRGRRSEGG